MVNGHQPKSMHIKIVPDDAPRAPGEWIEVPIRTQSFLPFKSTTKLYEDCIPNGFHAVSFTRHSSSRW